METCGTCINCINQDGIFMCKVSKNEVEVREGITACRCYCNVDNPEWKIWLDDLRTPPSDDWIWEKSVIAVITRLEIANYFGYEISVLSLDNDLGERQPEGYKVLDRLEAFVYHRPDFKIPKKIQIHSANPVARRRMEQIIEKNGWK